MVINSYDCDTSIAQYPVKRRVNLFRCCYLCSMSTNYLPKNCLSKNCLSTNCLFANCLCEHARARVCDRAPASAYAHA